MLVPNYYVPLLRWRMGEYQALSKLNDGVRARTVPLVEVLPPDYDFELHKPRKHIDEQLKPFVKQVAKHWSGRPAMVDAGTGRLTEVGQMPWYVSALFLSAPLHFGDYGGLPMQLAWAAADLLTMWVLVGGFRLWLRRG